MPGSRVLVIVFFTAVLFAGISSLINLFEAPIAALQQQFKLSRRTSVSVITAAALAIGLCIQGIVSGGWILYPSISALLEQVWPVSCFSGYLDRTMRKKKWKKAVCVP